MHEMQPKELKMRCFNVGGAGAGGGGGVFMM